MASELIKLTEDSLRCDDARFSICYARGASFRKEGKFFRVEKGARSIVHRSLCLTHFFGTRCTICPGGSITIKLEVVDKEADEP